MVTVALRRFAGTALTAIALATAACGGDDGGSTGPGPTASDVAGSYSLTGVRTLGNLSGGGNGLPVTFVDGSGDALTFNGGTLVLDADGSYTLEVAATFKGNGVTMTDQGTYNTLGNTVDFDPTSNNKRMKTGKLSGTKMTAEAQFGGIPFEIDLQK